MTRIIVVEDDIGQLEELVSFLEYSGHEVCGATNGGELESCLSQFDPEIVLLDYCLPGKTGAALAERLRGRFGTSVGIVMVTALNRGTDRIECRLAGADNYLVKPVNFAELLALIDNMSIRLNSVRLDSARPNSLPPREQPWQLLRARSELMPPKSPAILLTSWELSLLLAMAGADNQQADRDTLIKALGKNPSHYDPRALETCMSRLRRKLPGSDNGGNPLQAVRGIGYKFIRPLVVVR
ncbi:MAG: response regulator transcription factor [Nitrosomonadales bacterium]|nr:response regulator transcription factor [Nitrosomonadales bacterium]